MFHGPIDKDQSSVRSVLNCRIFQYFFCLRIFRIELADQCYLNFKKKLPIHSKLFISVSRHLFRISVLLFQRFFFIFYDYQRFFHHTKLVGSRVLLICWYRCSDTPGNCERFFLLLQLPYICGERCTVCLFFMVKGGFMVGKSSLEAKPT